MKRQPLLLLLFLLPVLSASAGDAYVINNAWPDGDDIIMDDVLLPAATWSDPAQFQMSEWNELDVTNNSHPFLINASPQFSFGAYDGDNTIGFLAEAGALSEYGLDYSSSLAWAVCWGGGPGGTIDECDVMLDPTLPWMLGPDDDEWFQSTVLHELGHVRGLGHFNAYHSMQNSGQSKYLRNEILYMDDRVGVRQNASTVTERDIVMYNKWHDGAAPQWMSMSPTTLREGETIDFENITVENRGSQSFGSTVRFGIYLSTNDLISTGDQLLNTGSFGSFGTFTFSTFDWSATMPAVNDCVTRYVGGIIDDDDAWSERFEGNNDVVFTDGVPFTGTSFTPTPIEILLAEDAFEPNDSFAAAHAVTLPFSGSNLSIDQDAHEDWYQFTVPSSGDLDVDLTFSDGSGNLDLHLRNSVNAVVASSTSTTDDEAISETVTTGTYYVRVNGVGSGSCNEYSLDITHTPPPPPPPPQRAFSLHAGQAEAEGSLSSVASDGPTLNLDLVRQISTHWAWDVRLGMAQLDGQPGLPDIDVLKFGANLRYTFNPGAPVRLFVNGGPHVYDFDPGSTEGGANLGLGLRVPAGPTMAIEATYNYHWAVTASPSLELSEIQVGLLVSF